jgi:predicted metal-dependent hydrolase
MNETTAPPVVLSNGLPQPPIPPRLRELLADYPDHLERIQEALNYAFDGPRPARGSTSHIFEQVIWALEGRLETFFREAKAELTTAQASGDAAAIAQVDAKFRLMIRCRSSSGGMKLFHMDELTQYIEAHKDELG